VLDEPLQLLIGPAHALAGARSVTVAELAGHRIWIPGIAPGTEWAAYYDDLVAEFGLTIESTGPNFGSDALLDTIADTPALATFMGEHTRLIWPADHGLRRIPVIDPTPVYPHSLLWHRDNPHPALAALRAHLATTTTGHEDATWVPNWVIPRPRCSAMSWRPAPKSKGLLSIRWAEKTLVPISASVFLPTGAETVVPTTRLARRKVAMHSPLAKEAGSSKSPAGRRCR